MGEATAVKRVEGPVRTIQNISVIDQIENTFNALAGKAYETFEANGRTFGRDLDQLEQLNRAQQGRAQGSNLNQFHSAQPPSRPSAGGRPASGGRPHP